LIYGGRGGGLGYWVEISGQFLLTV
jgi:hypothetical protein